MAQYLTKAFTYEGKKYYVRGRTKDELIKKEMKKRMELENNLIVIEKNMLVSSWIDEWLETYKLPKVEYKWYKETRMMCRRIIVPQIGNMKIKDVKATHLQRILNSMSGYSKSYINKIYNILREIFKAAKSNKLVIDNPAEALIKPVGKKSVPRRPITQYERKILLQAVSGFWGELFIKLQLYCGLRPGEAAALVWADVNFKKGILSVEKAMKHDGSIGEPKTQAGHRKIPIPEEFLAELSEKRGEPFDFICKNASGFKLTESSIKRMWMTLKNKMQIEAGCKVFRNALVPPYPIPDDLVMYCLRHTYCTDLQAAGVPINVARELMGHSDISMTAKIYTHFSEESFEDAREKIQNLYLRRAE